MKILILSDLNSPHTLKWVRSLAANNLQIHVCGLSGCDSDVYEECKNVKIYSLGVDVQFSKTGNDISKLRYLFALFKLKRLIKEIQPNILHAHYATSYGLLGAFSGFQPFVISVWGSDVFDFPKKSIVHKVILQFILSRARKICSTSYIMAKEVANYTAKNIEVVPFGVDLNLFKKKDIQSLYNKDDIVIGTIKTLEEKYGVEYLIMAFSLLKEKYLNLPLKLLIGGGGSLEGKLKKLTDDLGLKGDVLFVGKIAYDAVSVFHNMITIPVFLSISESFGVAAVEAAACEKVAVVSNVGGLPEVVENGVTGFVVSSRDVEEATKMIEKLIFDQKLRDKMGRAARDRVCKLYDWQQNVRQQIDIYNDIIVKRTV